MAKRPINSDADDTLAQMIANWPTLYRSRMAALERVFCSTYIWRNGMPYELDSLLTRDETYDQPLDETLTGTDKDYYPNVAVVRRRRDRAKALFVRENAALIARAESGEDRGFTSVPAFSTHALNRIPLDTLTQEWRGALVEYCNEVVRYDTAMIAPRNTLRGYNQSYSDREIAQAQEAKKAANECLIRLGQGSKDAEEVRRHEIQKLRYLAESFGLKLVPADEA